MTTLTVAPIRAGRVDRAAAGVAMSLAPLVGAALGCVVTAAVYGLDRAGAAPLLAAALGVALLAALTRGLHLDGLADTVDALGSYRDRDRALAIMKSPEVGPFGVVAIVLVLAVDAAAVAELVEHRAWWAIAVGVAAGRVAIPLACRRGVPSARPDGLGAFVAGGVPTFVAACAVVLLGAVGYAALPHRPWFGAGAAAATLVVTIALLAHTRRRLGGITGDVLGAACELGTAAALVLLALA